MEKACVPNFISFGDIAKLTLALILWEIPVIYGKLVFIILLYMVVFHTGRLFSWRSVYLLMCGNINGVNVINREGGAVPIVFFHLQIHFHRWSELELFVWGYFWKEMWRVSTGQIKS